jgi:hypothetical protein
MRRVLAAPAAKFLLLDAIRRRLAILHGRVVPLFALATLQRNNFSGHTTQLLAETPAASTAGYTSAFLLLTSALPY